MRHDEKGLVRNSYSYLQLICPPKVQKMTQHHQNVYDCETCIKAGTYRDSLNHWRII